MAEHKVSVRAPPPPDAHGPIEKGPDQLHHLIAQATSRYSVKDYNGAADLYSQATELQAEINGEMSPQNADLLYAYGRCLYHVAVDNSDVLGSKIAGVKDGGIAKTKTSEVKGGGEAETSQTKHLQKDGVADEVAPKVAELGGGLAKPDDGTETASKPYFQFTGDENFDTSDDEAEDEDQEEAEDEDDDDDFANAFEVLDLARVLLQRKLNESKTDRTESESKESSEARHLKERLADTYDLQAEISLEGERFPNAVQDLKSALTLKTDLFSLESSLVAEAHYKLSLALEFSSMTRQKLENGKAGEASEANETQVDEAMRDEAAQEMEAAIASCKLRIEKEGAALRDPHVTDLDLRKPKVGQGDVEDVKQMVQEMEQRVSHQRYSCPFPN